MSAVGAMAARLTVPFRRGADQVRLPVAADGTVGPYDFVEHLAEFGRPADPAYAVAPGTRVTWTAADGTATTEVSTGLLLLPPGAVVAEVDPPVEVTALLGTTARLLWVLGAERDTLRQQAAAVRAARLGSSGGRTLDLVGYDLGVPRFPPLAYTTEPGTLALYHLDEPDGPVPDATVLYGGTGHPGTATGAVRRGAVGRFGGGAGFGAAGAEITVPDHAELRWPAGTSLTVECFARPAGDTAGLLAGKHPDLTTVAADGWLLAVGDFGRGRPRNVRFAVGDGTDGAELFADRSLPPGRFTHVAGVLDRAAGEARLLVDGEVVDRRALSLGPVTPADPLVLGRGFAGTLDEVRLSAAARTGFHPVLGEDDGGYRRRLRIFQRWTLPTPAALADALNDAVGPVAGVARPLVLDDRDATLTAGELAVAVTPVAVRAGDSLDDLGRRGLTMAAAAGDPADDPGYAPELLVPFTDPALAVSGTPSRRMRVGTRRALTALLASLPAGAGPVLVAGWDPAATDLRRVGRALRLRAAGVAAGRLAALALRAGFHWAAVDDRGVVTVASRDTAAVELVVTDDGGATAFGDADLCVGESMTLGVVPLPPGAEVRWSQIAYGAGRVELDGGAVTARRPGPVAVQAEVLFRSRAYGAVRALRVGVRDLDPGVTLNADGTVGGPPPEDAALPGPAYLTTVTHPQLTAGPDPDLRRMQPATAARLVRMLEEFGDPVTVVGGWRRTPGATAAERLAAAGRALRVRPAAGSSPADLAAQAHAVGFGQVSHDGTTVLLLDDAADPVTISGDATVAEGDGLPLAAGPRARPAGLVALGPDRLATANQGTDTVTVLDPATGRVRLVAKVGVGPVAVAAAPDGGRLATADRAGGTVSTVDAATGAVRTASPGGAPVDVAFAADGKHVYAAVPGQLVELDAGTLAVTRTVALPAAPTALARGARLWVGLANGALALVDPGPLTVTGTVPLAGPPAAVAVGPARAYVSVATPPTLHVLDLGSGAVVATRTDVGPQPDRLAVSPDGGVVWLTDRTGPVRPRRADGTAQPAGAALPASTAVGGDPVAVAATADRAHVLVSGAADGVCVLDATAGAALAARWPLGSGHGERLVWSTSGAPARLSSTTAPAVRLTTTASGPVRVRAVLQWPDASGPYTVVVRPAPGLPATAVLTKAQYDLAMNVLNELHPIGVEIDTRALRERVLELRGDQLEAFPGYTYPDFRARGPRPADPRST